jgi:hypothetical protein
MRGGIGIEFCRSPAPNESHNHSQEFYSIQSTGSGTCTTHSSIWNWHRDGQLMSNFIVQWIRTLLGLTESTSHNHSPYEDIFPDLLHWCPSILCSGTDPQSAECHIYWNKKIQLNPEIFCGVFFFWNRSFFPQNIKCHNAFSIAQGVHFADQAGPQN